MNLCDQKAGFIPLVFWRDADGGRHFEDAALDKEQLIGSRTTFGGGKYFIPKGHEPTLEECKFTDCYLSEKPERIFGIIFRCSQCFREVMRGRQLREQIISECYHHLHDKSVHDLVSVAEVLGIKERLHPDWAAYLETRRLPSEPTLLRVLCTARPQ